MKQTENKCTGVELANLLLDSAAVPAKVLVHVEQCDDCRRELDELRATMGLLDTWQAPEPNPYFMTRLGARLTEEREAAPASWFQRLRSSFAVRSASHIRPLAAMAMTVMLLIGGGAYVGVTNWDQPQAPAGQAAVVHDLQTMDSNAQLLDQLETISSSNGDGN